MTNPDTALRWRTLERRTLFSGGPIRELAVETVQLPDGRRIDDYYMLRMPDFALVYATTPDGVVLLLRQYKHGLGRVGLSFPGGKVNDDEHPAEAARRELIEETGYASDDWTDLGSYVTNANQRCNVAHLFRARACRRVTAPNHGDLEEMELLHMPEAELARPGQLAAFGLASHVALLALATHPILSPASPAGGPSISPGRNA